MRCLAVVSVLCAARLVAAQGVATPEVRRAWLEDFRRQRAFNDSTAIRNDDALRAQALDTADIGGVRFVVPPRLLPIVAAAAGQIAAQQGPRLAMDLRAMLGTPRVTIAERITAAGDGPDDARPAFLPTPRTLRLSFDSVAIRHVVALRDAGRDGIERALLDRAEETLAKRADATMQAWLNGSGVLSPWNADRSQDMRRILVVNGGTVGRACLDGRLDACRRGLTDTTAHFESARGSLIVVALRAGGADAWGRLMADTSAPPLERAARAARLDPDTLVRAWRATLLTEETPSPAGTAGFIAMVLVIGAGIGRRRPA